MNFEIMKKVALLSAIAGAALGIVTLIPYLNLLSFLFLTFLIAPFGIIYMKLNNMLGIVDTREGAIWSAIIGFAAFTGFFVVFIPLSAIIGLLYKGGIYLSIKTFFTLGGGGIFVLILAYFMVGMLIALFNAFTGTFTAYVYQQQKQLTKEDNKSFQIDNQG